MTEGTFIDPTPDPKRRETLIKATTAIGGLGLAMAAYPFLASLAPSERAKVGGARVGVDVAQLPVGSLVTIEWRGKPVWVLHRSPEMLASLDADRPLLADPDSEVTSQQPNYARNRPRSIKPEYLVAVGICTHLGCVPLFFPERGSVQVDWPGGFYCPCHGSKFDLAGRVFKGVPAPTNLVIPPYKYLGDTGIVVAEDAA